MGAMPCCGGFDWSVRHILGDKLGQIDLFGTITLPWACRIEHWGDRVSILGTKRELEMVVRPKESSAKVRSVLQDILGELPRIRDDLSVSFLSLSMFNFWHPTMLVTSSSYSFAGGVGLLPTRNPYWLLQHVFAVQRVGW